MSDHNTFVKILKNMADKSGGTVRVTDVPPERRPNAASLMKLENEIAAQSGKPIPYPQAGQENTGDDEQSL